MGWGKNTGEKKKKKTQYPPPPQTWDFDVKLYIPHSTNIKQVPKVSTLHILELFAKSPCLWAYFHPLSPLSVVSLQSKKILIKSQYEMLKLSVSAQG